MARSVKLRRYEIRNANHLHLRGYRLRVEAVDPCGMDAKVFVYRRPPADPVTGVVADEFTGVASFPDMAEYPAGQPDPAKQPFFRKDFVEVDVRSLRQYQEIWQTLLAEVAGLLSALNRADLMIVGEEQWVGDPGTCASQSESDDGGAGGPGFTTFVIIPTSFAAGNFAAYSGATGRLVDTGFSPASFAPAAHATNTNNPHNTTAHQVGAYTQAEVNALVAGITGDKHYAHTQSSPATTWTIVHNLNKIPSITVLDNGRNVITGDVTYPDLNTAIVAFGIGIFGTAYAN
jgi:hypothetical protein